MARKFDFTIHIDFDPFAVARRGIHDDYVKAMREGRRQRATTIPNKRKVANKRAARGKIRQEDA